MELYFRLCYEATEKAMCNTLRQWACAAWIVVAACSGGSDVAHLVNQNAADPTAPGGLSADGVSPEGVSPGGESPGGESPGGVAPSAGSPSAEPGGPVQPPASNDVPASAASEEPQPNATETNFFTARCQRDADCGEARRCELPADAGSVGADAGSDAAAPDVPAPGGRCVAP
ncbi:MAG: hypothetical protein ABI895_41020 [Deltaproteobacteria bacterium]